MLYPFRFAPVYFEKVWGGRSLSSVLNREIPPDQPIGESWEVCDHPHGESVVMNGPAQGQTLHALIEQYGNALLGARALSASATRFPLLVKYIDAEDALSVQVHPDDTYGYTHEGEAGKTEMWYVVHADPGACLIVGLRDGVTREAFAQALTDGDPSQLLHHMPVKTGDSIFIPAGRIHAIMPGLLILEFQQNSDTTYRLYDWGRMGLDGKPRALHVAQAMTVSDWSDYAPNPQVVSVEQLGATTKTVLAACQYFVVEKYALAASCAFPADPGSFRIVNCVSGAATLIWEGGREDLTLGDTLLIPAAINAFTVAPDGNDATLVVSYVP